MVGYYVGGFVSGEVGERYIFFFFFVLILAFLFVGFVFGIGV